MEWKIVTDSSCDYEIDRTLPPDTELSEVPFVISVGERDYVDDENLDVAVMVEDMESSPEDLIRFYCKRGKMENFIKECKSGFDMSYVSSSSMIVNANRVQIHALAYNLFNWFRRLTLPESMRNDRIDTVRLKLLKIAARVVSSARYVYFKLCSYCD